MKKNIKLNVTSAALRTVDFKGGLDKFLLSAKNAKLSKKVKKLKNIYSFKSLINDFILQAFYFNGADSCSFKLFSSIPYSFFGLQDILTYGAFSYPITFLITDLANRAYGKFVARKIVYIGFL